MAPLPRSRSCGRGTRSSGANRGTVALWLTWCGRGRGGVRGGEWDAVFCLAVSAPTGSGWLAGKQGLMRTLACCAVQGLTRTLACCAVRVCAAAAVLCGTCPSVGHGGLQKQSSGVRHEWRLCSISSASSRGRETWMEAGEGRESALPGPHPHPSWPPWSAAVHRTSQRWSPLRRRRQGGGVGEGRRDTLGLGRARGSWRPAGPQRWPAAHLSCNSLLWTGWPWATRSLRWPALQEAGPGW